MSRSSAQKRLRLTLMLGAAASAAFGAVYGLVAAQGMPAQANTTLAQEALVSAATAATPAPATAATTGTTARKTPAPTPVPAKAAARVQTTTRGS